MSDNEDLLGDDLGDHSLADYNLGNEEEEQLLADDYEGNSHVPPNFNGQNVVPTEYAERNIEFNQPAYTVPETECVVPNLTVEVPNTRPQHSTYAPYDPSFEEHAVPPAIPAAPIESPQIVPSEIANLEAGRERFVSERPVGAQRTPQVRNIPDTLDSVVVPRGGYRGRSSWRAPHYRPHYRNTHFRANFAPRPSFPPPQRPTPPQLRPEIPDIRPEMPIQSSPDRPILPEIREPFQNFPRFPYRPEERHNFVPNQPFERPFRPFGPTREIIPNNNIPQVTIRQPMPVLPGKGIEPEVRMLPVLPPNLPGLTGKKVLINPHFKGNFQPPVEGPIKDIDDAAERFIAEQRSALARAATRNMRRSPQRFIENTTIEIENDLARSRNSDDELLRKQEEFIHANRAGLRRRMRTPSPRRSRSPSPIRDRDIRDRDRDIRDRDRRDDRRRPLLDDEESEYRRRVREQESMRERVLRAKEVRRRKNAVALQRQLQERERDRDDREKPRPETKEEPKVDVKEKDKDFKEKEPTSTREEEIKPDTTKKSPEREEKEVRVEKKESPVREEANSTCEALTPPRVPSPPTPATPPLPDDELDELDLILGDIDGILSDEEDTGRFKTTKVESSKPTKAQKPQEVKVDLRSKLPPKSSDKKPQRQKITFSDDDKKKEKSPIRRTIVSSSTKVEAETKSEKAKPQSDNTTAKSRQRIVFEAKKTEKAEDESQKFSNRRVILKRKVEKEKSVFSRIESDPTKPNPGIFNRAFKTAIGSDRIVRNDTIEVTDKKDRKRDDVPRKIVKSDDGSRKIVSDSLRKTVRDDGLSKTVTDEPQIEYESGSDEENLEREIGLLAEVSNLPHGMTDTRLRTLAGDFVQNLILDREERTAKITFKTTIAADTFKKKFNNKMVAASRLSVVLK